MKSKSDWAWGTVLGVLVGGPAAYVARDYEALRHPQVVRYQIPCPIVTPCPSCEVTTTAPQAPKTVKTSTEARTRHRRAPRGPSVEVPDLGPSVPSGDPLEGVEGL